MCRNACRPPTVRVTIVFIVVEGTHDTERFLGTTPFAEGWSYCCAVAVYSVVQYMLSLMKLVATESPARSASIKTTRTHSDSPGLTWWAVSIANW